MRRVVIGILVVLGILIAVPVVAFFTLDPNWLKPRIEAMASEALGRKVEIRGPLELQRGWTLRFAANDVHVENAPWGEADELMSAQRVEASVDLWQLLTHRQIAIPDVALTGADMNLERNEKGEGNWTLGAAKEAADPENRAEIPYIGQAAIRDSKFSFKDLASGYQVASEIREATTKTTGMEDPVDLHVDGTVGGEVLKVDGKLDPFNKLTKSDQPYKIDAALQLGSARTKVQGQIRDPANMAGIDLAVDSEVTDATELLKAVGVTVPELPDFRLAGKIRQEGQTWRGDDLQARVGKVEMAGSLAFESGGVRPKVSGELHCDTLRVVDVQELTAGKEEEPQPEDGRLIPPAPIPTSLPPVDVDMDLRCGRVEAGKLSIGDVGLHVGLEDGRLRVDPLKAGLAGGELQGSVGLDTREDPPGTELNFSGRKIALGELLDPFGMKEYGAGSIALRAQLSGRGADLRSVLANADGRIAFTMEQGQIGALLIEAMGIDVGEILAVLVGGKESPEVDRVELRCFVADLQIEAGTAFLNTFVMDTSDSVVTGKGALSLKDEQINLTLEAHPKDSTALASRAPIRLGGTLGDLSVDPGTGELAARGVAAAVLGVVATPLAAILPFIDVGTAEDAPCGALLAEAQQGANVPENNP
jgi:uncharacterized protein involved in outer membrane biogenesis